jgi:hypothetical protein
LCSNWYSVLELFRSPRVVFRLGSTGKTQYVRLSPVAGCW